MVKFYKKLQIITTCYGYTITNNYYEYVHQHYHICYNIINHLLEITHDDDTIYRCADPEYYAKRYSCWNKKYSSSNKLAIKQLMNKIYEDLLKEEEQFVKDGFK